MKTERKFNINWLEIFRLKFKATIPQPLRGILVFSIMIGIPILCLYAIIKSIYTWWSITCFVFYFGVVGLSVIDSLMRKHNHNEENK